MKEIGADDRLGLPTTWVDAADDPSTNGVLAALRAGRAFISRDIDGPQLYFDFESNDSYRVRVVDAPQSTLTLVTDEGVEITVNVGSSDWSDVFRLPLVRRYVRAQIADHRGQMLALTNALFKPVPRRSGPVPFV